jgi:hypothetical protein
MRRLLAILFVLPIAAGLLAGPPASAAPAVGGGTFAGTLGAKLPKGAKGKVRAIDRVTGRVVASGKTTKSGSFTLALPAGAYTVVGVIVPQRGKAIEVVSAVTLKAGQKRKKANLKAGKRKKQGKAKKSFLQEGGQRTPGRIAVAIPDFQGALTGDDRALTMESNNMALGEALHVAEPACDAAFVETDHIKDITNELDFQRSKYVDPSTAVKRNFIIADVRVDGTIVRAENGDLTLTGHLKSTKSGKDLGTVSVTVKAADVFEGIADFGKQLGDEICKLSDTYEVALDVNGVGRWELYTATAEIHQQLIVRRKPKTRGDWTGSGPLQWTNLTAVSSFPQCRFDTPDIQVTTWQAALSNADGGQLKVSWGPLGPDIAKLTQTCELPPSSPPPIPGLPGVEINQLGPASFNLPAEGGTQQLSGGVGSAAGGFFNTGTLKITPGDVERVE